MSPIADPAKISKHSLLLTLLLKPSGAALSECMVATGWQTHSVRGYISAVVRKRLGLLVLSHKSDGGLRRYRIEHDAAQVAV